jgi:hypothetical protein
MDRHKKNASNKHSQNRVPNAVVWGISLRAILIVVVSNGVWRSKITRLSFLSLVLYLSVLFHHRIEIIVRFL